MRLGPAGLIEVVSPFDAVTWAQLRTLRPRGRWSARRRCWEFPLEAAAVLEQQLGARFPMTAELQRWLAWLRQPLPPLPPHRQLVVAADLESALPDGRRLFAHQRAAARWLLARRGAVLADAMGLGKTLTALAAARAMVRAADCRLVVLAPAGLHHHWQTEAASLALVADLCSWARIPQELPAAGCVLIVDEAHFAQTITAARTQAFLRLARHPRLRAIWLLTGTPMKNGRPAQLFPLLAAIGHPLAADQRVFEERYCQGHWREQSGRRVWSCQGAERLEELQRLIRPLLLHRPKDRCLDLPPKHRRLHPVVLDAAAARGFAHRLQERVDDYRRRCRLGEVRRDAEVLALFTALRQIASDHKLPAATALLGPLLEQGESVVVFTAFVKTARQLQWHFGGEHKALLLTGAVPVRRRQALVDRFQSGSLPLLIATFGTAGLGYTLHRARHVLLMERPWTPGDTEQAEDRCHRIGMGAALTCHWLQLGAADQLVDALIADKADRIARLLLHSDRSRRHQALAARVRQMLERW
ncbi:MAG: SNF2-related protein [Cyanobium sp.]